MSRFAPPSSPYTTHLTIPTHRTAREANATSAGVTSNVMGRGTINQTVLLVILVMTALFIGFGIGVASRLTIEEEVSSHQGGMWGREMVREPYHGCGNVRLDRELFRIV